MPALDDLGIHVTLTPADKITFVKGENTSKLYIKNSSNKNIAFKIRTTQPLCFMVKPNSGILEAMTQASAEIQYVANEVSSDLLHRKLYCCMFIVCDKRRY